MKIIQRFFLITLLLQPPVFADDGIVFIVNASNAVSKLTPEEISDFFLKKKRDWTLDGVVRFIDHIDGSQQKKTFLGQVLKQSDHELELFWIGQKLYTGNSAPMQVSSDQMAVSLVARFPGAISYVSSSYTNLKDTKKIEVKGGSSN